MRVVVVGSGICGASIAFELAKAGHEVVVVEDLSGPAGGVTSGAMGWINAAIGVEPEENPALYALRQEALEAHYQWDRDFGGDWPFRQTGSLIWEKAAVETECFFQKHYQAGAAIRRVGAGELKRRIPRLRDVPEHAVLLERDGVLDTVAATELLLKLAGNFGCQAFFNTKAIGIVEESGRISGVQTRELTLKADAVVLANGTRMKPLLAPFGIEDPVDVSPAALVRFEKVQGFSLEEIICAPNVEVRQLQDGRLQVAEDAVGLNEAAVASKAKAGLLATFNDLEGRLVIESVRISGRPMPRAQWPMTHRVAEFDNLWTFGLHPGVILAPLAARRLASEIGR